MNLSVEKMEPESFVSETVGKTLDRHSVLTEDGYILTLLRFRYPGSDFFYNHNIEDFPEPQDRPVVLLVHGFIVDGTQWLMSNSTESSLPMKLHNAGYDVWLANLRGCPTSLKHNNISISSEEYWNYSLDEIAQYDIPAIIYFILGVTKKENLLYVGHSMGCSALFALASLKPEFCSKITAAVALDQAVYGKDIQRNDLKVAGHLGSKIVAKYEWLYKRSIFPMPIMGMVNSLFVPFLEKNTFAEWIFKTMLGVTFGVFERNLTQIEKSQISTITKSFPASSSVKLFCHGSQCLMAETFQQYDYGSKENCKRYGQESPPRYDLQKVNIPVVIIHSENDELCPPKDLTKVFKELPKLIDVIESKTPGHNDFVYGKVLDILNKITDHCQAGPTN